MSKTTEAVEGILESTNKRIALLIAVLALLLAATEMLGQNAKQEAQASNIEASNLWAFFQAKTIRRQQVQVAATDNELRLLTITDEVTRTAVQAQIQRWRQDAARLDSEPETNEGRRELMVRAQAKERGRDLAQARDGWLDFCLGKSSGRDRDCIRSHHYRDHAVRLGGAWPWHPRLVTCSDRSFRTNHHGLTR
jgi:hypothetical protein